jgi:hypothetical protein
LEIIYLTTEKENEMDERTLVAIMATIIFSGADDKESPCGYNPKEAVVKARSVLKFIDTGAEE